MKLVPLAICMFATVLAAQDASKPATNTAAGPAALQAYLNLSDAQLSQLRQLRADHHNTVAPIRTQLAPLQKQLRDQIASGADAATIAQTAAKIEPLRKQLTDANDNYKKQALAVLNPDQTTKLNALEEAMKLAPAIRQAVGMGLISGPAGFTQGFRGPGMAGMMRGARGAMRRPPANSPRKKHSHELLELNEFRRAQRWSFREIRDSWLAFFEPIKSHLYLTALAESGKSCASARVFPHGAEQFTPSLRLCNREANGNVRLFGHRPTLRGFNGKALAGSPVRRTNVDQESRYDRGCRPGFGFRHRCKYRDVQPGERLSAPPAFSSKL